MESSRVRVDALIHLSDQVYPILEQKIEGEMRARRILRLGIASVAISLNEGATVSQAGRSFDDMLAYELRTVDFGAFTERGEYVRQLDKPPKVIVPLSLGRLANRYGDVERETMLEDATLEPDSVHALHLASWAVPFAQKFYPELDSHKVSLYSLIHDLPEAYAGDVSTFDIDEEGLAKKKLNEEKALKHIERVYGNRWPGLLRVAEQYEALADDEAAYVKTADKNEPGFVHRANNAATLRSLHGIENRRQFYISSNVIEKRIAMYGSNYPLLIDDRRELNRRVAKLFP